MEGDGGKGLSFILRTL